MAKEPVACSIKDAALHLGVPAKTLYRWVGMRMLEHLRIGGKILIEYQELDNFRRRFRIPRQDQVAGVN